MSCEDRISALHDDLLLKILSEIPTKDVVTTMVLSKRWGLVWTMVPKLEYKDTRKEGDKSVWCLLDKSLQLHKATVLESLHIQVERQFCDDADVGKCVSCAVDHKVRELALILPSQPKILQLPSNVYTSKTLVKLTLSCRTLVVDVPSLPCLPSLLTLVLLNVVYKDQNSHVRLLSNCPALRHLEVQRNKSDNVTRFIVKVPSLKSFTYMQIDERAARSFVLDSPGLRCLTLGDPYGDLDSIQNMPHLEWATVCHFLPYPNDNKFLRSFSSVRILWLTLTEVACCSAIKFPQLMKFTLHLHCLDDLDCSLEPLLFFLHNSPVLKVLMINYVSNFLHVPQTSFNFDRLYVGKCVSYAVDHKVRELALILPSQPKILQLPSNVYTSKTLVKLTLSCRTLVVDVPSLPCLPSLQRLALLSVVYKDKSLMSDFYRIALPSHIWKCSET
uniref:Uncharacterized protein n=1 Tax=Brassica campestris TaxID=3711 RepID=A0A3P5ZFB2_BRACM|nr:unnamed protein product [Brassica rapa]